MNDMKRKYTDAERIAILAEIKKTGDVGAVLAYHGVPRSTYQEWKRRIAKFGSPAARIGGRPRTRTRTRIDDRLDALEDRVGRLDGETA